MKESTQKEKKCDSPSGQVTGSEIDYTDLPLPRVQRERDGKREGGEERHEYQV